MPCGFHPWLLSGKTQQSRPSIYFQRWALSDAPTSRAKPEVALRHCGIDPRRYSGHSFRIGAASAAARVGVEDCYPDAGEMGIGGFSQVHKDSKGAASHSVARIANVRL